MDNNRLQQLLNRYFEDAITTADCKELLAYLDEGDPAIISAAVDQVLKVDGATVPFSPEQQARVYKQLIANIRERQSGAQERPVSRTSSTAWLRIAAMLVV